MIKFRNIYLIYYYSYKDKDTENGALSLYDNILLRDLQSSDKVIEIDRRSGSVIDRIGDHRCLIGSENRKKT